MNWEQEINKFEYALITNNFPASLKIIQKYQDTPENFLQFINTKNLNNLDILELSLKYNNFKLANQIIDICENNKITAEDLNSLPLHSLAQPLKFLNFTSKKSSNINIYNTQRQCNLHLQIGNLEIITTHCLVNDNRLAQLGSIANIEHKLELNFNLSSYRNDLKKIIKKLVRFGFNPNAKNHLNQNFLQVAAIWNCSLLIADVIELYLDQEARWLTECDFLNADDNDRTLIHYLALWQDINNIESLNHIYKTLEEKPCNLIFQDYEGNTPLHYLFMEPEFAPTLIKTTIANQLAQGPELLSQAILDLHTRNRSACGIPCCFGPKIIINPLLLAQTIHNFIAASSNITLKFHRTKPKNQLIYQLLKLDNKYSCEFINAIYTKNESYKNIIELIELEIKQEKNLEVNNDILSIINAYIRKLPYEAIEYLQEFKQAEDEDLDSKHSYIFN